MREFGPMKLPLIPCGVIKLAAAWNGTAALLGGCFTFQGRKSPASDEDHCLHGRQVEVIYGSHSFDRNGALLPEFVAGQPYDRTRRVRVWKLEEKRTDVNLALQMYRDVNSGRCERIILVSNDSDAAPALAAIRSDFPQTVIGVVMPVRPRVPGVQTHRRTSGSLAEFANWVITSLEDVALTNAQLPQVVPTNKKPIVKPLHW